MGDIADMMLEGLLDEETGEYIGDVNLADYGTEAPGFPRSLEREYREGRKAHDPLPSPQKGALKVNCPVCNKRVKVAGLKDHCLTVHGKV